MNLTREQTHTLFNIQNEIEWFNESSSEAFHTLYIEDCETDSERNLVIDLIRRIKYLDNEEYHEILENFVKDITKNYKSEETIITVTAMNSESDSSQLILYEMKSKFKKYGWSTLNTLSNLSKVGKKASDKKNIIIVDEFIGTGQTMNNKVEHIRKQFHEKSIEEYNIHIYTIAGTLDGLYSLMDIDSVQLTWGIELEQGISEKYTGIDKDLKIKDMKRLESLLSDKDGKCELINMSLGYGGTETLYTREHGNTPNNVFPIFWWSRYSNTKERKTLMIRMC